MQTERNNSTTPAADQQQADAFFNEDLPTNTRLPRRARLLLSMSLVGLVGLVVLLPLSSLWLGPARQVWARIFPPAPYHGTLVYGTQIDGSLVALRSTDGGIQWINHQPSQGLQIFTQGSIIIRRIRQVMQGLSRRCKAAMGICFGVCQTL